MKASTLRLSTAVILLALSACKSWRPSVFEQRSPREQYAHTLKQSGVDAAGWLADGDSALGRPTAIRLPYGESGIFPAGRPAAVALRFDARRGERIMAKITTPAGPEDGIFMELHGESSTTLQRPAPGKAIDYIAEGSGTFAILVQGRIDISSHYELRIYTTPSLAYPATNPAKNRIGSVWGDARDGGGRKHEGVDIFAPKGSPALAAASGRISRLGDGGLGGKTVWLRPDGRPVSLYYAHLDSQWVRTGDYVRAGDTLGQIGNTGNAKNTAAHLHFGIYTADGAVDPAPFVRLRDTIAPKIAVPQALIGTSRALRRNQKLLAAPDGSGTVSQFLKAGTRTIVLAGTQSYIRVRVADTALGWLRYEHDLFR